MPYVSHHIPPTLALSGRMGFQACFWLPFPFRAYHCDHLSMRRPSWPIHKAAIFGFRRAQEPSLLMNTRIVLAPSIGTYTLRTGRKYSSTLKQETHPNRSLTSPSESRRFAHRFLDVRGGRSQRPPWPLSFMFTLSFMVAGLVVGLIFEITWQYRAKRPHSKLYGQNEEVSSKASDGEVLGGRGGLWHKIMSSIFGAARVITLYTALIMLAAYLFS